MFSEMITSAISVIDFQNGMCCQKLERREGGDEAQIFIHRNLTNQGLNNVLCGGLPTVLKHEYEQE